MPHDSVSKILEEYKKWNETPMSEEGWDHLNESFAVSRLQTVLRLYTASQHHIEGSRGEESDEMHKFFTHCSGLLLDVLPVQIGSEEDAIEMFSYIYGLISSVWQDGVDTAKGRNE